MQNIDLFTHGLAKKKLISITYNSKKHGIITRKCAPMDYGPLNKSAKTDVYYHAYDLESPNGEHPVPILPENVILIVVTEDPFNPEDIISWERVHEWHLVRDWGMFS